MTMLFVCVVAVIGWQAPLVSSKLEPPRLMECIVHRSDDLASRWNDVAAEIARRTNTTRRDNDTNTTIAVCKSPGDKCVALWLIDDANRTNILLQGK